MSFHTELYKGFAAFLAMLQRDNEANILLMPYAEYSLQLYIIYHDELFRGLLHESRPLAKAFCDIGIDQPRDQLLIFLDIFYIHWHTHNELN